MPKKYKYRTTFTYDGRRYEVRADSLIKLGEKKAKKLECLKTARNVVSGDMLLSEWAEKCIETYKTNQAEITREKFEQRMKSSILSEIGSMPIKRIKPIHCQRVMNLQTGKSPTQVGEVYHALKFLFSHAYSNNLIISDPTADLVKPLTRKKQHRRALTSSERTYFLQVGITDRRFYLFLLMLLCGCRPEEAAECQGRDILTKNGAHFLHIRGTKTAAADREVPLPDMLFKLIKDIPGYDYIACTSSGHRIDPRQRRRIWKSYCRQINISMGCKMYRNALIPPFPLAPDLVPYCLRHEYCTELARRGIDIRVAQKLMGHTDIKMTANIYTNLNNDDLSDVASELSDLGSQRVPQGATPGATSKYPKTHQNAT
ncbi:MAG: tyrosine-type recombinase/integrase [Anaerovoracaceae bacterium]|jgi:integrase